MDFQDYKKCTKDLIMTTDDKIRDEKPEYNINRDIILKYQHYHQVK